MPQSPAKTKKRKMKWGWKIVTRFNEHDLQIHIATMLHAWALSRPHVWWTGIDHAARLSPKYGRDRKMRGIKPGIPDFHLTCKGKSIWLEAKSETGKVSPIQAAVHEQLRRSGGYVFLVRKLDEVWTVLNWLDTEDWDNPPQFQRREPPPQFIEGREKYLAERRRLAALKKAGAGEGAEQAGNQPTGSDAGG